MRFVDTNVLLYAVSTADHERAKAGVAIVEAARALGCRTVLSEDRRMGATTEGSRSRTRFALLGAAPHLSG